MIDSINSAWPSIKLLSETATNAVNILPATPADSRRVITQLQQSTQSAIGAVVYYTGGILIDNGWIRILGSGHSAMKRNLTQWNNNKTTGKKLTLIADDALGGIYVLNDGGIPTDSGKVHYCSPKDLIYKSLETDYEGFLKFCFAGDLDKFYKGLRWKTWRQDVQKLSADEVYLFLPFLWKPQGGNIEKDIKKTIPVEQKYFLLLQEIERKKALKKVN
ncbi:DUF2625 domain-containing protein [Pedobacter sp. MC2016-14]|uniref:DUF2625 family protein n=1 Tax=Pedobacter sp. MC2016-14 TaxID=2897327 RepID=UPI001E31FE55|nr:DUF2625 family protein [Pedobacter sp. MC2016-14]MCD0488060.1 DUF2625 domain-containing protein [Pedobacter sp. MC2016-14]